MTERNAPDRPGETRGIFGVEEPQRAQAGGSADLREDARIGGGAARFVEETTNCRSLRIGHARARQNFERPVEIEAAHAFAQGPEALAQSGAQPRSALLQGF